MHVVSNGPEDAALVQAQPGDSTELRTIGLRLMPEWLEMFARKNADYGSDGAKVLGVMGQYADINRKMLKLKRAIWDGQPMQFEGPREICLDLVGHLFLTVQMLDEEEAAEREALFGDGAPTTSSIGSHLKAVAEYALSDEETKKQIQEAYEAGRLSMMPDPYDGMPDDFELSPQVQALVLNEKMAYARRLDMDREVYEHEKLIPEGDGGPLPGLEPYDIQKQLDAYEADEGPDGFVESEGEKVGPAPVGVDLENLAESLKVHLPNGTYEIDSDGKIYRSEKDRDRVPMALVPAADMKLLHGLTKTIEESVTNG